MTDTTCRVCQKPALTQPMGEKDGYVLMACRSCGSVMTVPAVTRQQQEDFFNEIQPEATHLPDHLKEIELIKKNLLSVCPKPESKSFLDVACRNGYAVVAARQLGMRDTFGIDIHDFFIRFAQAKYDQTLFEHTSARDYADRGKTYDIIYCNEAFCEQPDLDAFTESLARLMAPGASLYIEEPDGNSFNVPRHFPSWPLVYPPANFHYLSKKGMTALLERHGLRVQKMFWNWRPVMRMIVTKV